MASVLYPKFKQALLTALVDLTSVNVKAVIVDTNDYSYSASHEFLSDVAGAARVATTGNLASKSVTDGVFDAADASLGTVSGDSCEAVILYVSTGTDSTSRLMAYIDSGSGLPFNPSGGSESLVWSNGANKIFSL
jgi:hypothetical protein